MDKELRKYQVPTIKLEYSRIFLLSDIHFGVRNNSLEWIQNQYAFFRNFYIPFLMNNVKKGDILFFLGDWYDHRQTLDIHVMNISIDLMMEMAEILPIHIITGNHDIYKKQDTDVNSLKSFKFIENVFIYEKPFIATNDQSSILVLPWVGDKEKEEYYAKANTADYIFAHTDISGFRYDNGRRIVRGAKILDIEGYKRIFSGHVHKRQEIHNSKGIYIGSPYHTKRSDIGNRKGVYIFEPEDNIFTFHKNKITSVFQRINLENLMEYSLDETHKILENNYTDIIVPDKYIQLFNLTKFIELLEGCKYKRIEARSDKAKLDESLDGIIEGNEIKDILSLLEMGINDLLHSTGTLIKLKLLNKKYYRLANDEDDDYNISKYPK
jgi:DNA repair exonuclease SbcCD nuclease subunit